MDDFLSIGRMTPYEYRLKMKAYRLKRIDQEYFIHLQAFKNQQVQETKGRGNNTKLYYSSFEDFFPYQKLEEEIMGVKPKKTNNNKKIAELLKRANS